MKFFKGNKIGIEGASKLAESLKINSSILHLNIGDNNIKDEGISRIASMLKVNNSITYLNLEGKKNLISLIILV